MAFSLTEIARRDNRRTMMVLRQLTSLPPRTICARPVRSAHPAGGTPQPLLLLTDAQRLPDPARLLPRLPPGTVIVLRCQQQAERFLRLRHLLPLCRRFRLRLSVAADPQLALQASCDLHLPEALWQGGGALPGWLPRLRLIRRQRRLLISGSLHQMASLRHSRSFCPDLLLASPVFATRSHPGSQSLGRLGLVRLARRSPVAVAALGGVTAQTLRQLRGGNADAIAGIDGWM